MQDIIDLILSNQIYMIAAGVLALGLFIFLLKKVFKLAMMLIVAILAYGAFLYMTEDDPMKVIKEKLDQGKSTVKDLDDATRDMRRETIDKVLDDVEKQLKEKNK